jgi:hypothetical protein
MLAKDLPAAPLAVNSAGFTLTELVKAVTRTRTNRQRWPLSSVA